MAVRESRRGSLPLNSSKAVERSGELQGALSGSIFVCTHARSPLHPRARVDSYGFECSVLLLETRGSGLKKVQQSGSQADHRSGLSVWPDCPPLGPGRAPGPSFTTDSRRYPVDSGALLARFGGMKRSRKSQAAAPTLVCWRASVIRKRLEHLGRVWAPDKAAAETAAVAEFGLSDHERQRLILQEQP